MTETTKARQQQLETLFDVYVMETMDPGEFYRLSNDRWLELLDEAEECYDDADQFFPFTEDDVDEIRTAVDAMLEKEFGFEVMREYAKTR